MDNSLLPCLLPAKIVLRNRSVSTNFHRAQFAATSASISAETTEQHTPAAQQNPGSKLNLGFVLLPVVSL